jgi:topoisomerase-4 subunit B
VIATDADVDGMHIRLLLMTFFMQFFPDLVRNGHIYILETPLFRVRNKQKTYYCYSEEEKQRHNCENTKMFGVDVLNFLDLLFFIQATVIVSMDFFLFVR